MLYIHNLTVCFQDASKEVLKDISLSLKAGEVGLVLGGNDSGKSTLLHCISGIIPRIKKASLSGSCTVVGGQLGVLLQDSDLFLLTTVQEELDFCLLNAGVTGNVIVKMRQQVEKQLKIDKLEQRQMHTLSGGERQRVALGAALISRPQLLLLDEPLAQLDIDFAETFLNYLCYLAQAGVCILVSSTSSYSFRKLPFRFFLLEEGRLIEQGDRKSLNAIKEKAEKTGIDIDGKDLLFQKAGFCCLSQKKSFHNSVPVLSMHNVSYAYQDCFQLKDVELEVFAGEIVAITGPNGSGKTTLLKLAAGIFQAECGEIQVLGKSIRGLSIAEATEKVGFLFQNPDHQLFQSTVNKEVAWGLLTRGCEPDIATKKAWHMLKKLGIEHLAHEHPYSLSKATRQWVALASVLVQDPLLLLLDEPTIGLDTLAATRFMEWIMELAEKLVAVALVTHQKELAYNFAHRVVSMNEGRVIPAGNLMS